MLEWQQRIGYRPRDHHDLTCLRHIYSTGSPLAHALFDYVYERIHPNVLLASITGMIYKVIFVMRPELFFQEARTSAHSLLGCVLRCRYIVGKSNVVCWEWQSKPLLTTGTIVKLARLASWYALDHFHVCPSDFGPSLVSGRTRVSRLQQRDFVYPILLNTRTCGVRAPDHEIAPPLTNLIWIRSRRPRADHTFSAWKWRWTHHARKKRWGPVSVVLSHSFRSDHFIEILEGSDSDRLKYTTSLKCASRFLKSGTRTTQLRMHWLWRSLLKAAQMSA